MRIILAALILTFGTTAGSACGNPLLWAMLFAKVPEARIVHEAELAARADGLITARVYNARPGQAYHLWSKAWIMDLAREMQPTVESRLAREQSLTILLADEVAAIRFSRDSGVEFVPAAGLGRIEHYDLITSTNALKSVWRDGLSFDEMLTFDLARTQKNESDQFLKAFF